MAASRCSSSIETYRRLTTLDLLTPGRVTDTGLIAVWPLTLTVYMLQQKVSLKYFAILLAISRKFEVIFFSFYYLFIIV